jgi:hypothetical protein
MKVRVLFADASYGPDQLKVLCKAFDEAWDIVSPTISARPDAIEAARMRLANIILGLANDGSIGAENLTRAAVQLMADPKKTAP